MTANAKSATTIYQVFRHQKYTLTSGQTVYQGDAAGLVASTGKVVKWASGRTDLTFVGVFEDDTVATADTTVLVDRLRDVPAVKFANDTVTPITVAGEACFAKDSATVTGDSSSNSSVGPAVQVDTDGVWLEVVPSAGSGSTLRSLISDTTTAAWASNEWAPTGASLVSGTVYSLPATGAASKVTLPTTGNTEGVIIYVSADGTKNGHTVTFYVGATAVTAALTASKRILAVCVYTGGTWCVNAAVAA